ncbi:MAG: glycosyltransferase [Oscillospiraceae bacterium]|nr:glycosyltransferase [Oscillospiraceae bacterium]
MNKIIIFTSRFPFRTVFENFFQIELFNIAKGFDKVYIVACDVRDNNPEIKKELPENAVAIHAKRKGFISDFILGALSLPFCPFFIREIKTIVRQKRPFLSSLKSTVYSGCYYLAIRRCFGQIAREIDISQDDNVVLMGYWLHYISQAALLFKKYLKLKNARVFSRAHGSADIRNFLIPNKYYPLQANLLSKLDAIFPVSEMGRDYLRALSGRPEAIESVYIGSVGPSDPIPRCRSPFTIVTCSNIIPLKRVGLVADAVRLLCRSIPDIRWVHFGDGPLRQELESSCADIQAHIDFCGYTPHDKVLEYLASEEPSVFVSASASEGLPVSVVEAIAHSIPVIATDVGATREAVIAEKSGTLIPADITSAQLAQYIYAYYNMHSDEYAQISKSAFLFWKQNFAPEVSTENFLSLLKRF